LYAGAAVVTAPREVVVVGRDVALWLAATSIRSALAPAGVTVRVVELPTTLDPASIHASLPPLEAFHRKLGIDEAALLRAVGGSFSLGQHFAAAAGGSGFFHAWSAYGTEIEGHEFFPVWVRAMRLGLNVPLQDFCLAAVAARHGRMLILDEEIAAFGHTDYAYHLPALAYAAYLKTRAAAAGVTIRQATSAIPRLHADGASIAAIQLDSGESIAGDLFIDASGAEALLMRSLPDSQVEDWSGMFPVDRLLTVGSSVGRPLAPYADTRASQGGWTALIPSRSGMHIRHAYSSHCASDDEALDAASVATGLPLSEGSVTTVAPALRRSMWNGNAVAIGEAACMLDPVHSADVHAAQLGMVHLLSLFPVARDCSAERDEYNRIMRSQLERIRDFQSAFYTLSPNQGAFWDRARAGAAPAELASRIDLFRARGIMAPMEDESFSADSWRALLVGSGIMPESWPPATDLVPLTAIQDRVRRILSFIKAKVLEQPRHDEYLDRFCRREAA
jgi:tryptophan halogenase